ncbi:outer membrane protein [Halochromatium roseum]|uniref:outer membrane protein n=1 Tax=Halochromatium roseum TaxID=391920 RepID=UPI00191302B5|nr:outer membrane beta-barrel protein [Halochromatium roseum]MBK5939912.1 hypothetical protein [Halochromatium roseum]
MLLGLATTAESSDWYLRATLGGEQSNDADVFDRDCASQQPAALFGCVRGDDGRPIGAYGDFGRYPLIEVALGKRLLPWLRTDLSLGYRFDSDYQGNANFLSVGTHEPVSAQFESWSSMVNAFVDLAPLIEADLGRFQPFVGVGAGLAYNQLGKMTYRFPQNPYRHKLSVTPDGERTSFTYRLTAGTGIRLTDSLMLDLAVAYSDLGKVGTNAGVMAMNHVPRGIPIDETETHLRALGLSVGLRYGF